MRSMQWLLFAFVSAVLVHAAPPAAGEQVYTFVVPKSTVDVVLNVIAQQANTQVLFPFDKVKSIEANAVFGEHTLATALSLALNGTSLSAGFTKSGVIQIVFGSEQSKLNRERDKSMKKNKLSAGILALVSAFFGVGISADTAQQTEASFVLEEIVVTARKREERLQDVPSSISVFNSTDILRLGIADVEDSFGITPGLYFTGNFLSPNRDFRQLVIRGVGANSQLEPSTATFIDGVYSPSLTFDMDFLDLQQVEILKGPQGTLFGRNTEGGAINIVTRKPSNEVRAKIRLDFDEFDTFGTSVAISGPLVTGKLAGSIAVMYDQSEGFVKQNGVAEVPYNRYFPGQDLLDQFNSFGTDIESAASKRTQAVRGALRWIASDRTEVNLTADAAQFAGLDQAPGPLEGCDCYVVDGDQKFEQTSDQFGAALRVDVDFGGLEFVSITGFRESESSNPFDFDGSSIRLNNYHDFDTDQRTISQEFRLTSSGDGRFHWLAGLYGFDDKQDSNRFYSFSNLDKIDGTGTQHFLDGLVNQQLVNIDRTGWAVFGQARWDITDVWELTAGVRFSEEEADVEALTRFFIPPNEVNSGGLLDNSLFSWPDFVTPVMDNESWSNVSPTVSLKYAWNEAVMTYLTVSQGFKAGSYQKAPVEPADVFPIDPEETTNYELGFKASLMDRHVLWDTAIYSIEIKDQQLQSAIIRGGIVASAITNAATSEVQGFESSLTAQVSEAFTFWANVGLVDSEFSDYQITPDGTNVLDRSGDAFPNTPEWTWYVAAEYRTPVGQNKELSFYAGYRYVDNIYVGSDAAAVDPIIDVPSWHRIDLRVTLGGENWHLTVFAENVTDEYIVLSKWNPFFVQEQGDFIRSRVAAPQRVGVTFQYDF